MSCPSNPSNASRTKRCSYQNEKKTTNICPACPKTPSNDRGKKRKWRAIKNPFKTSPQTLPKSSSNPPQTLPNAPQTPPKPSPKGSPNPPPNLLKIDFSNLQPQKPVQPRFLSEILTHLGGFEPPFGTPKASQIDQKSNQNHHQKKHVFQAHFFIVLTRFWKVFVGFFCEQKCLESAKPKFLETFKHIDFTEVKLIFSRVGGQIIWMTWPKKRWTLLSLSRC